MNSFAEPHAQSISLTLPAEIVKEANSLFPQMDLRALTLKLLEKYLRHEKRKLLAQQYQQYYHSLTDEERTEEKELLADFAVLDGAVNAFIEAEEADGSA